MNAKTYLLMAPAGEHDLLGRALGAADLIARLKVLNPRISVWEQFPPGLWWPGKDWQDTDWGVKSTLWLGLPGEPDAQKISAINMTTVPEHTQVGPDGKTIVKGWRAIFEKVIKAGAVAREDLERAFGVTLAYDSRGDLLCKACAKQGRRRRHNGGLLQLCVLHEQVITAARDFLAAQQAGTEALIERNAQIERRLEDVDTHVQGESRVGWTPSQESSPR